jgi:uncharacterized protein (UPF0212 family)
MKSPSTYNNKMIEKEINIFNEDMGWYKCPACGVKGGIRKLVENNI